MVDLDWPDPADYKKFETLGLKYQSKYYRNKAVQEVIDFIENQQRVIDAIDSYDEED